MGTDGANSRSGLARPTGLSIAAAILGCVGWMGHG